MSTGRLFCTTTYLIHVLRNHCTLQVHPFIEQTKRMENASNWPILKRGIIMRMQGRSDHMALPYRAYHIQWFDITTRGDKIQSEYLRSVLGSILASTPSVVPSLHKR